MTPQEAENGRRRIARECYHELEAKCPIERNEYMNRQKRAGQFQLRLTENLKEKVVELAKDDGISQNAIINQAVAWYVKSREKDIA